MESTIVKILAHTANLCCWLCHPDCPEAICQLKILVDQCFVPENASSSSDELVGRKGLHHTYVHVDELNFSGSAMHSENASIFYWPTVNEALVAGQIQWIKNIFSKGENTGVHLHVQLY